MDEHSAQRVHARIDHIHERLVRVETRYEDILRRLEGLEELPEKVSQLRSSVDRISGKLSIMLWLLFAIGGGLIAAGFELFKGR